MTVDQFSALFDNCLGEELVKHHSKVDSLKADLLRRLEQGLEPLSKVPEGANYVRKAEYRKLEEQVWAN